MYYLVTVRANAPEVVLEMSSTMYDSNLAALGICLAQRECMGLIDLYLLDDGQDQIMLKIQLGVYSDGGDHSCR